MEGQEIRSYPKRRVYLVFKRGLQIRFLVW